MFPLPTLQPKSTGSISKLDDRFISEFVKLDTAFANNGPQPQLSAVQKNAPVASSTTTTKDIGENGAEVADIDTLSSRGLPKVDVKKQAKRAP
jgi:hypothetical protein